MGALNHTHTAHPALTSRYHFPHLHKPLPRSHGKGQVPSGTKLPVFEHRPWPSLVTQVHSNNSMYSREFGSPKYIRTPCKSISVICPHSLTWFYNWGTGIIIPRFTKKEPETHRGRRGAVGPSQLQERVLCLSGSLVHTARLPLHGP